MNVKSSLSKEFRTIVTHFMDVFYKNELKTYFTRICQIQNLLNFPHHSFQQQTRLLIYIAHPFNSKTHYFNRKNHIKLRVKNHQKIKWNKNPHAINFEVDFCCNFQFQTIRQQEKLVCQVQVLYEKFEFVNWNFHKCDRRFFMIKIMLLQTLLDFVLWPTQYRISDEIGNLWIIFPLNSNRKLLCKNVARKTANTCSL